MHAATARLAAIAAFTCASSAQQIPASQPPVWSTRPDVAAFERPENERLGAAQKTIADIAAVSGPRTVENTVTL
jgi:hypothetical protein